MRQSFVIPGEPPSKARPRFTSYGKPYTPKRTVEGERRLRDVFAGGEKYLGNVAVSCVFYRSSRQRIDVDNMLKAVLDAATKAELWDDDSQVTLLSGTVEYDRGNPRTEVSFSQHTSSLKRGIDASVACESCGKRFVPGGVSRQASARWCSRLCRMTLADPVRCAGCGNDFKRKAANQKFCSVECRGISARRPTPSCTTCGSAVSKPSYQQCRSCWKSESYLGWSGC